jgi:hypothetical protein
MDREVSAVAVQSSKEDQVIAEEHLWQLMSFEGCAFNKTHACISKCANPDGQRAGHPAQSKANANKGSRMLSTRDLPHSGVGGKQSPKKKVGKRLPTGWAFWRKPLMSEAGSKTRPPYILSLGKKLWATLIICWPQGCLSICVFVQELDGVWVVEIAKNKTT